MLIKIRSKQLFILSILVFSFIGFLFLTPVKSTGDYIIRVYAYEIETTGHNYDSSGDGEFYFSCSFVGYQSSYTPRYMSDEWSLADDETITDSEYLARSPSEWNSPLVPAIRLPVGVNNRGAAQVPTVW